MEAGPKLDKDFGSNRIPIGEQTEEKMFGSDVAMTQLQCLMYGVTNHRFRPRGEGKFAFLRRSPRLDQRRDLLFDHWSCDAGFAEKLRCQPVGCLEQGEQQVLGSHETVAQTLGLFLGMNEDVASTVSESLKVLYIEGEPLMGRLLADTEGTADLRPRASAAAALINKVAEQGVARLFEISEGLRCLRKLA